MTTRFARNGHTNPLGKLGDPINGLRLAESTEEIIRQQAALARMPIREFIRRRLEIDFHGREAVEHAITVSLDLVAGTVREK